jgi:seryl-tRNA synthetase
MAKLGFEEWIFPRITPLEIMEKALPIYLEKIPDGMFYVCQPPRDPNAFKEFKQDFVKNGKVDRGALKNILKMPDYVLEPAQCIPFYQYFENQKVDYPVKAMDYMGGWTWRNEAGGVEGIIKTNEFLRMEFVYLGTPEQVRKIRMELLEETTKYVEELGLEYRWVIGAPFYIVGDETKDGIRVDPNNLDEIPTIDLEVLLPYNNKWLEVTAFNVHGNKYTKAFKIKAKNGNELWTGCTGFGITRWLAVLLAQKGFDKTREIFGLD